MACPEARKTSSTGRANHACFGAGPRLSRGDAAPGTCRSAVTCRPRLLGMNVRSGDYCESAHLEELCRKAVRMLETGAPTGHDLRPHRRGAEHLEVSWGAHARAGLSRAVAEACFGGACRSSASTELSRSTAGSSPAASARWSRWPSGPTRRRGAPLPAPPRAYLRGSDGIRRPAESPPSPARASGTCGRSASARAAPWGQQIDTSGRRVPVPTNYSYLTYTP